MKDILKRREKKNALLLSAQKLIKKPPRKNKFKTQMDKVIKQIKTDIPKDITRKVCKKCFQIGHDSRSSICQVNKEEKQRLLHKIKTKVLSTSIFDNMDDVIKDLSQQLQITENQCKTLYYDIPAKELLNRRLDISQYNFNWQECEECHKQIANIHDSSLRDWKNKKICDSCWNNYRQERDILWQQISKLKPQKCVICNSTNKQRYHYDHVNMFNKGDSICRMVDIGESIENIREEVSKCQVVCINCHQIITDFEIKMGFTRIKTQLTRKSNEGEDMTNEAEIYEKIYQEKMDYLYGKLKEVFLSIQ